MKDYNYRRTKLNNVTEEDLEQLHQHIDDIGKQLNKVGYDISCSISKGMVASAETLKLWPKDEYELNLLLYLENIKPRCRSSSYLDE